jgi:SPASM domain peptide maturase of grasp-with-spasm system
MKPDFFKLFSCCIPVKGANRSLLCDVQRSRFQYIDNSLYDLLEVCQESSIAQIKKHFGRPYYKKLDLIIQNLVDEEWGFVTSQPELFPLMNLAWEHPSELTNAILDIANLNKAIVIDLFRQLDKLGCKCIQLRFFSSITLAELDELLNGLANSRIQSIEILIKNTEELGSEDRVIEFVNKHLRINSFIIHDSPVFFDVESKNCIVLYTNIPITSSKQCGIINSKFFTLNIESFTEAKNHNSCLNRKISIDVDGNIKNCPSMPQSFGNVKTGTLQEALDHPDFKKYWNVTKDQIAVCKDCEFKYVCTDCRAYIENPEDLHSKPLKCGYNPYTAVWEAWSTNPLKQMAIDYYGMREVLPEFKMKPDYAPAY